MVCTKKIRYFKNWISWLLAWTVQEIFRHDKKKPGSYDKVIESIKTAKNKIPVVVNTCVMSSNIHDIKELSLVIKELDVNWTDAYYEPTIVKDWQQGSNLTRLTEDLLTKIVEIGKSNKNLVNSEEYLKTLKKRKT